MRLFRLSWHSSAGALLAALPAMDQESLRALWLHAPEGRLSPWEQAKALGLREASKELHGGKTNLPWIAARVSKVGGGHPQKGSLREFFKLVDADADWFPGKRNGAKRGRKPDMTPAKRRRIAQSAMAAKAHGNDPCVAAVVTACPEATRNESTGMPFCEELISGTPTSGCSKAPDHAWIAIRRTEDQANGSRQRSVAASTAQFTRKAQSTRPPTTRLGMHLGFQTRLGW